MVRLFETSDRLEEHLNRFNLRSDQVASIAIDGDGFFVLVYWVGPPDGDRSERPARAFGGERPFVPRRPFRDDGPPDFDNGPPSGRPPHRMDRGPREFGGPRRGPGPRRG